MVILYHVFFARQITRVQNLMYNESNQDEVKLIQGGQ